MGPFKHWFDVSLVNQKMLLAVGSVILALGILSFALASQMYPYFSGDLTASSDQSASLTKHSSPTSKPRNIATLHLFGRSDSPKITEAPKNFSLNGVFLSSNRKLSTAVIVEKGKEEERYGIGDRLPNGAVIKEIHIAYVILSHKGIQQKLEIQLESVGKGKFAVLERKSTRRTRKYNSKRKTNEERKAYLKKINGKMKDRRGNWFGMEGMKGLDSFFGSDVDGMRDLQNKFKNMRDNY